MSAPCIVHPPSPAIPDEVLNRARNLASSLFSDVFGRWAGAPGILPIAGLKPGQVIAGRAFTVRTRPGDNLVVHKALDLAEPGDVLIIDAGGATDRAILGGLMGSYASTRSLGGLVVDGAVRDVSDLDELAPPTFARGVSHLGPYKDGPGDLRGSVSLAGVTVHNGDLVIGDEDGIAVVPRERIDALLVLAEEKAAAEREEYAAILRGEWDRTWVDRGLDVTWR